MMLNIRKSRPTDEMILLRKILRARGRKRKIRLMQNIENPSLIPMILHRIGDEALMEGFFLSTSSIPLKKAVIPCLNRLERCVEWYKLEKSPEIRVALLTRISNWSMKKSLLLWDDHGTAILQGLKTMEERSEVVLDIINHHWDKKEVLYYLEQCENQAILQKAACHGISKAIRQAAMINLNIEKSSEAVKLALLRVIPTENREYIQTILNYLEGPTLMELAKNAKLSLLPFIEEAAQNRGIGHLLVTMPNSACH